MWAGLCVDSRMAPMSHNCFVSLPGHPLPALFSTIWDRLEVSSLFVSVSKCGQPMQNDMTVTSGWPELDFNHLELFKS